MPTYEYECLDCNHRFEVFQRITEDPLSACEKCKGRVRRVIFPAGIVFKGSGFHVNDYPRSGSSTTSMKGNGNGRDKGSSSESKTEKAAEVS